MPLCFGWYYFLLRCMELKLMYSSSLYCVNSVEILMVKHFYFKWIVYLIICLFENYCNNYLQPTKYIIYQVYYQSSHYTMWYYLNDMNKELISIQIMILNYIRVLCKVWKTLTFSAIKRKIEILLKRILLYGDARKDILFNKV